VLPLELCDSVARERDRERERERESDGRSDSHSYDALCMLLHTDARKLADVQTCRLACCRESVLK